MKIEIKTEKNKVMLKRRDKSLIKTNLTKYYNSEYNEWAHAYYTNTNLERTFHKTNYYLVKDSS